MRIGPSLPPRRLAPRADARAERIEHWMRGVQETTLASLRGASSAYAGQMVGMAVGAAVSAPLAVQTGNVFVFFGGAALLGCLGAYAAYRLDRHRPAEPGWLSGALAAGTALQAVPRFAYPSLMGASPADRAVIMGALDRLPMGSVTSLSSVRVLPGLEGAQVSGMALPAFSQNSIYLDRESLHSWGWGQELVAHEVGHTKDFERVGYGVFGGHSLTGPFGRAPFVTWYAGSNRLEDFAETHAQYHVGNREALRAANPAKLAALEELQRPGLGEEWASRPAVRGAGRSLGQALESLPYLRQGLELAGGLVAPLQLRRGARALEHGFLRGDERARFQGKMALASGLMLLAPAGPVGALLTTAGHGLVASLLADDRMSLEQANRVGDAALAAALGPLGMIGVAVLAELGKGGVDLNRVAYAPGEHPTGEARAPAGLPWALAGASLGLLAGASLGALAGGAPGAISGMFWGPLAGGALGLGASRLGSRPSDPGTQDLTPSDRAFLARVIGCGAVAGLGGTLAGGHLGALGGASVGSLLLGPAGAVTGAWVGRLAGGMLGAWALGRAGAFAGRRWDEVS